MAKAPLAGLAKTRLAREIGTAEATRFARVSLRSTVMRLGRHPFWRTLLTVTPDSATRARRWPPAVTVVPQGRGDLGQRMQRPMRTLPPGPVCVIGSDIPEITVADIRRAFRLLGSHDIVFGPAADGGFWLVGQRRRGFRPEPYAGVAWSRPDTLARILDNLGSERVGFTTARHDVDTLADFRRLASMAGRIVKPPRA